VQVPQAYLVTMKRACGILEGNTQKRKHLTITTYLGTSEFRVEREALLSSLLYSAVQHILPLNYLPRTSLRLFSFPLHRNVSPLTNVAFSPRRVGSRLRYGLGLVTRSCLILAGSRNGGLELGWFGPSDVVPHGNLRLVNVGVGSLHPGYQNSHSRLANSSDDTSLSQFLLIPYFFSFNFSLFIFHSSHNFAVNPPETRQNGGRKGEGPAAFSLHFHGW
jgi:hypothetical protein